ncbi:MAG: hypothetical protein M1470_09145, partial [Bacteroidetes bacterium]|nr:hypothetical protein [Bacteroidota bacterium]MCL5738479.1 hypothetical protein [Bacteroidota bacterium]
PDSFGEVRSMSFQLIHTFHKREKVAKREKYSYYCVNFFQDDTEKQTAISFIQIRSLFSTNEEKLCINISV